MKALISGRNGFIGIALDRRLTELGYETIELHRRLLYDIDSLKSFVHRISPDYIFHLSAYGNHSTQNDWFNTIRTNIKATYNLLDATKDIPYKGFINFGSSSEYGRKGEPMKESDLLEPVTMYGATKASSTLICDVFARTFNKPIITVRPFSVYGEGEAEFRFIPTVIKGLLNKTFIDLAPDPKHDWIYIHDFIDGVLTVANSAQKLGINVVNIGTGKQYTNMEVVEELEAVSGLRVNYDVFGDKMMRSYDTGNWVADNSLLKSLGWTQKNTLKRGLEKTYAYYKSRFEKENN